MSNIWRYSYGIYYIICGSGLLLICSLLAYRALALTRKSRADYTIGEGCGMEITCGQEETQLLVDLDQETAFLNEETVLLDNDFIFVDK